jgi:hypothetical protein
MSVLEQDVTYHLSIFTLFPCADYMLKPPHVAVHKTILRRYIVSEENFITLIYNIFVYTVCYRKISNLVKPRIYMPHLGFRTSSKSNYSRLKRIDYKSELLNLYLSLYFTYIFLYAVQFKLFFNSKKALSYFYRIFVG